MVDGVMVHCSIGGGRGNHPFDPRSKGRVEPQTRGWPGLLAQLGTPLCFWKSSISRPCLTVACPSLSPSRPQSLRFSPFPPPPSSTPSSNSHHHLTPSLLRLLRHSLLLTLPLRIRVITIPPLPLLAFTPLTTSHTILPLFSLAGPVRNQL